MIAIKATTVGSKDTPAEALRKELEQHVQMQAKQGWTLRAMASRGGTMYLVFAKKEK